MKIGTCHGDSAAKEMCAVLPQACFTDSMQLSSQVNNSAKMNHGGIYILVEDKRHLGRLDTMRFHA